jgi:hypothetical protein
MNLSGFAGEDGDVIVVVFNRENFVAVALGGNGDRLEKTPAKTTGLSVYY